MHRILASPSQSLDALWVSHVRKFDASMNFRSPLVPTSCVSRDMRGLYSKAVLFSALLSSLHAYIRKIIVSPMCRRVYTRALLLSPPSYQECVFPCISSEKEALQVIRRSSRLFTNMESSSSSVYSTYFVCICPSCCALTFWLCSVYVLVAMGALCSELNLGLLSLFTSPGPEVPFGVRLR